MLLAAVGTAGCVDLSANDHAVTLWEAQLAPEVTYPDLSGQAAAVSGADGTEVGIAIAGATPGAQHVWGLRLGTCVAPGQQIGSDAAYPELIVSAAGTDSVETHLGAKLSAGGAYHVAVRLSASDTARVACGDLMGR